MTDGYGKVRIDRGGPGEDKITFPPCGSGRETIHEVWVSDGTSIVAVEQFDPPLTIDVGEPQLPEISR